MERSGNTSHMEGSELTGSGSAVIAVQYDDRADELVLLDQTLLPNETRYIRLTTKEEVWDAIYHLRVRGAPAIGIAAAYGAYLGVRSIEADSAAELAEAFDEVRRYLASSRPTAVNLSWALSRLGKRLSEAAATGLEPEAIKRLLKQEADVIRGEDESVCRSIGEHGLPLLQRGWGILTHCNAGTVATAKYGTALSPIYLGHEQGYGFHVFADETRPLLQGARLTAWELDQAGVDVTVICDNMASIVMKQGWIQAVLVGCDRVAANGDTANKIGTSAVAILARHYGVPFYVCAPLSTIDMKCEDGAQIPIEQRPPEEVTTRWYEKPMAPKGVKAYNPAFDVTDHELITAFVTEKGVLRPPFGDTLRSVFSLA